MKKIEEILLNLEEIEKKYFPARWHDKNIDREKEPEQNLDGVDEIVEDEKYFHKREVLLLEEQKAFLEKTLSEKIEDFENFRSELIKSNQFLFEELERRIVEIDVLKKQFLEEKEKFNNIISEKDKTFSTISNEIKDFQNMFENLSLTVKNTISNNLNLIESEKKDIKEAEKNIYAFELNKLKEEYLKTIENELKIQKKDIFIKLRNQFEKIIKNQKQFVEKTLKGQMEKTDEYFDVIKGVINYSISNYEIPSSLKEHIREIEISLNEIKLLNEKLYFSLNIQTLKIEKVNIYEVINNVLESFNPAIKEKKITINYSCKEPIYLNTDFSLIYKAISNVVSNSIEAIEAAPGGVIDILIEKNPDMFYSGDYVVNLSITDNGSGISEEYIGKIFHPFFSTKRGMSGLGLNQTEFIMQIVGGDMKIDSRKIKGTCVRMNFYPVYAGEINNE